MAIKIAHFSGDENRGIKGGKAGDQTGRECCVRDWYSQPWDYYIEITDEAMANRAADIFTQVANRNEAGYDQSQRLTFYDTLVACNGDISKMAPCESDCSAGVSSIYKFVGLNVSQACTTRNLRAAFEKTGKVKVYSDKDHVASDKYAKRGGLFLKEGKHVAMAVENGSAYTAAPAPAKPAAPTPAPSTPATGYKNGDIIKLKPGAKYYNGKAIPSWVFNKTLYYRGTNNQGIIFSTLKTGAVTGVVTADMIEGAAAAAPANKTFKVQILADALYIRKGPGTTYVAVGTVKKPDTYTIAEEQNGWGRLENGKGWISLNSKYSKRL